MAKRSVLIAAAAVVAIAAVVGTVALTRSMSGIASRFAPPSGSQASPQPAAEVNGEVITRQQVEDDLGLIARQYGLTFEGPQGEQQRKEVVAVILDQLIERTLIMQEARRRGLVASDAAVDAQIKEIRARFTSPREFNDALEQRGFTLQSLRERIRADLTTRALVSAIGGDVAVSDAEVRAQYEKDKAKYAEPAQVKAKHILVATEREAQFVMLLLRQGKPFADLAKQYSTDPGSKDQGGDLGWVSQGQTVPEFERAAFAAKPGELVGPVRSQFGFHIILVEDKKAAHRKTFDEVKDEIRRQMVAAKQQQAFDAWLKETKKNADIKKYA